MPLARVDRPMDKVFIAGLEIETLIGIYEWERKIRQPLVFDIEMGFDNRVPAATTRRSASA
jgi:dihydroneopterin aldolase